MSASLTRRSLVGTIIGFVALPVANTYALVKSMIVHRDPSCGCCEAWAAHIRGAGINATIVNETNMNTVKSRLGVPSALVSCHTAEISGYVIEGHVPAKAILQLLRDKPDATGLAAPGMPVGSPGMESGGAKDVFEVVAFGVAGSSIYGRYRGEEPV